MRQIYNPGNVQLCVLVDIPLFDAVLLKHSTVYASKVTAGPFSTNCNSTTYGGISSVYTSVPMSVV